MSELSIIETAKKYAIKWHGAQTYGDDLPYFYHLEKVTKVLERFGYGEDEVIMAAGWLHDVLEDTQVTEWHMLTRFHHEIVRTVMAVTDEPGPDRATRKLATYPKIRCNAKGLIVKLADRIANVEAAINGKAKSREIALLYRAEWADFHSKLYFPGPDQATEDMWTHLEFLIRSIPAEKKVLTP